MKDHLTFNTQHSTQPSAMFRNYLTVAFRHFRRNKTFSFINVLGLAIGISASVVIFLIAGYELGFENFVKDKDRIYRVVLDAKFNGNEGHSASVPAPLNSAVPAEMTGIEMVVPMMQFQGDASAKVTITGPSGKEQVYKKQDHVIFTNNEYFTLLGHEWLAGSRQAALNDPFKVVLAQSRAALYFPGLKADDIIGRQISYNNITVTVSGIVKDLEQQTAFTSQEFISYPTIAKTNLQNQFMMNTWTDWMAYSQLYVKLSKGNSPEKTETELNTLFRKYHKDADKDGANYIRLHLQPLEDIHFNGQYAGFGLRIANKKTLYGLFAIAAFLLLLGCINFINLTTAQASARAKEIGIRKTMGGSKKNLVSQFLSETFIISLFATLLSITLVPLLLRVFADFIPAGLSFDLRRQPEMILFLAGITVLVTFLSGFYPALVLSGYRPALVLKNQVFTGNASSRSAWVRKTLTVGQFVIAQFFIIATVMVSRQINYSLQADLGFNKESVIYFDTPRDSVEAHGKQLLYSIKSLPGVEAASTGFLAPADAGVAFTNLSYHNGKEELKPTTQIRWGDTAFLQVYGITLLAGRNVLPSDTIREFLVNEKFAQELGFQQAEDILNKPLLWNGKLVPVVGVMKDFHDQSMKSAISPLVFAGSKGATFHIKLTPQSTQWKTTLAGIGDAFKKLYPGEEFNYRFIDDTVAGFYKTEQHTASLLRWATGLSVIISCLGLFGLVIYTTNTRKKEIGIRKILGATVANIFGIISRDFMQLVLAAFLIAVPVAWWATHEWLQGFAYRTDMSWWIFAGCGLFMLMLALITLSLQTIKAAMENPVKNLRTE